MQTAPAAVAAGAVVVHRSAGPVQETPAAAVASLTVLMMAAATL